MLDFCQDFARDLHFFMLEFISKCIKNKPEFTLSPCFRPKLGRTGSDLWLRRVVGITREVTLAQTNRSVEPGATFANNILATHWILLGRQITARPIKGEKKIAKMAKFFKVELLIMTTDFQLLMPPQWCRNSLLKRLSLSVLYHFLIE